jgi:hypothetical protein
MNANKFFDDAKFKEGPSSIEREYVLAKSVSVEKYISIYLSFALGINDYKSSKSFGSTSAALSFMSKITLFADLGILNSDERKRLIVFAEVRNRFAHNEECTTFSTAFTNEIFNTLNKFYSLTLDKTTLGDSFPKAMFDSLYKEIVQILEKVRIEVYGKSINKELLEFYAAVLNHCIHSIQQHPDSFNQKALQEIFETSLETIKKKMEFSDEDVIRVNFKINWGKGFD